jgi:hypothetical protein
MKHISIRDLQKMSERAILALPGATRIQSGDRPIALLVPFKKAAPAKVDRFLAAVSATREAALRAGVDEDAEDRTLAKMGMLERLDLPDGRISKNPTFKKLGKKKQFA